MKTINVRHQPGRGMPALAVMKLDRYVSRSRSVDGFGFYRGVIVGSWVPF